MPYDVRDHMIERSNAMNMDTNIAAWMAAGGPRIEIPSAGRDRLHRLTLEAEGRSGSPLGRLKAALRPAAPASTPAGCPA